MRLGPVLVVALLLVALAPHGAAAAEESDCAAVEMTYCVTVGLADVSFACVVDESVPESRSFACAYSGVVTVTALSPSGLPGFGGYRADHELIVCPGGGACENHRLEVTSECSWLVGGNGCVMETPFSVEASGGMRDGCLLGLAFSRITGMSTPLPAPAPATGGAVVSTDHEAAPGGTCEW